MLKAKGADLVQRPLSGMAKRSMTKIMAQCNGFGQIFIEPQGSGNGPGNL